MVEADDSDSLQDAWRFPFGPFLLNEEKEEGDIKANSLDKPFFEGPGYLDDEEYDLDDLHLFGLLVSVMMRASTLLSRASPVQYIINKPSTPRGTNLHETVRYWWLALLFSCNLWSIEI